MIPHDFKNLKIRQPKVNGWEDALAGIGFVLLLVTLVILGAML